MTQGHNGLAPIPGGRTGGFTLVEMLVVISIIVLLVGLTMHVATGAIRRSEISTTENTLRILDEAMREWELMADRQLTWGKDGVPPGSTYDVHPHETTPFNLVLTEMLDRIARVEPVRHILARIPASRVYVFEEGVYPSWLARDDDQAVKEERFVGDLAILDAWDMPIYGLHPGGPPNADTLVVDPDGTEQTYNELYFGVAVNRRIGFISAGPDRQFGNVSYATDSGWYQATLDNVFSYPIAIPSP